MVGPLWLCGGFSYSSTLLSLVLAEASLYAASEEYTTLRDKIQRVSLELSVLTLVLSHCHTCHTLTLTLPTLSRLHYPHFTYPLSYLTHTCTTNTHACTTHTLTLTLPHILTAAPGTVEPRLPLAPLILCSAAPGPLPITGPRLCHGNPADLTGVCVGGGMCAYVLCFIGASLSEPHSSVYSGNIVRLVCTSTIPHMRLCSKYPTTFHVELTCIFALALDFDRTILDG